MQSLRMAASGPRLGEYLSQSPMDQPLPDVSIAGYNTLGELFAKFYTSIYGIELASNNPLYVEDHGYDPYELVRLDLGENADPWGHNFLIPIYAQRIMLFEIRSRRLHISNYQLGRLLFGAGSHDWEEAVMPDIAYGKKTKSDRRNAAVIRRQLWDELYANILPKSFIDDVESLISHEDENSAAHNVFMISHHSADYITAVARAGMLCLWQLNDGTAATTDPAIACDQRQRFFALASLAVIGSGRMKATLGTLADMGYAFPSYLLNGYSALQNRIDTELAPLVMS
jgi:hypothetical protein